MVETPTRQASLADLPLSGGGDTNALHLGRNVVFTRAILTLLTQSRQRGHVAVFHNFAEGLARLLVKRRPTARVRAVGP